MVRPEILKRQKENKKVLITTSKLKDFKFCELQSSVVRNMKISGIWRCIFP